MINEEQSNPRVHDFSSVGSAPGSSPDSHSTQPHVHHVTHRPYSTHLAHYPSIKLMIEVAKENYNENRGLSFYGDHCILGVGARSEVLDSIEKDKTWERYVIRLEDRKGFGFFGIIGDAISRKSAVEVVEGIKKNYDLVRRKNAKVLLVEWGLKPSDFSDLEEIMS